MKSIQSAKTLYKKHKNRLTSILKYMPLIYTAIVIYLICSLLLYLELFTLIPSSIKYGILSLLICFALAQFLSIIQKKIEFDIAGFTGAFLLIAVTLILGLNTLNEKTSGLSILDLPPGTIGLRAWESETVFEDIHVKYFSKDCIWKEVPNSYVSNPANWIMPVWCNHNPRLKSAAFARFCKDVIRGDRKQRKIASDFRLILNNCGAVLKADGASTYPGAKSIRLDATIIFRHIAAQQYNPSCQLCLRVPLGRVNPNEIPDLYVGFELLYHHLLWSKVWIPALDFAPKATFKSALNELSHVLRNRKIKKNQAYKLCAWIFDNSARFQIFNPSNGWTVILYEGRIGNQ